MNRINRKRKRNNVGATIESSLQLIDEPLNDIEEIVPENSKVINYLNKLSSHIIKPVLIKLIVSITEGAYFEKHLDSLDLKGCFSIKDISLSDLVPGTVERFITVFGDIDSVAKCLVYVSFILKVKVNNFNKLELHTLKSANYALTVLILETNKPLNHGLVYLDTAFPSLYHPKLGLVEMKGSFTAMYNFIVLSGETVYIDDGEFVQKRLFGRHIDLALFVRSEENGKLLHT